MALAQEAKPMVGQVGGIANNKKPLLTLAPDYVLKPVITDHRGIREIAFYEAIRTLTQSKHVQQAYSTFLTGRDRQTSRRIGELFDTIAMALAIFWKDQLVLDSEVALRDAWRGLKREVDMIRQLQKFSPLYYGVMGLSEVDPDMPFGVTEDTHLLLQDLTVNFSKPCVMDLKMGVQSYVSAISIESAGSVRDLMWNIGMLSNVVQFLIIALRTARYPIFLHRSRMRRLRNEPVNMGSIRSKPSSAFELLACAFSILLMTIPMRKGFDT